MHHPAGGSVWGAVLLTLFLGIELVAIAVLVPLSWRRPVTKLVLGGLLGVATAAAVFQAGHMFEHVAPGVGVGDAETFMTPWAAAMAGGFGRLYPHVPDAGMEILHLVGNAAFFVGAVALVALTGRLRPGGEADHLARWCMWIQGAHVLEHVLLTGSVVAGGRPFGVSTLFGLLSSDAAMWTYRLWWHLAINVVVTILVAKAIYLVWRSLDLDAAVRRSAVAEPLPA